MSASLALPCYEGPGGELVMVEQADDHHHHHRHHHDDDDDLNKLQFSCTKHTKRREGNCFFGFFFETLTEIKYLQSMEQTQKCKFQTLWTSFFT